MEQPPREPATGKASAADLEHPGQLLGRGAEFLQTLGKALSEPPGRSGDGARRVSGPRIETEPATGRPELRVTLPDERVLNQVLGQLSNVLKALTPQA